MTDDQIRALRAVAAAFIDSVRVAGPSGAPSGVMYAACIGRLSLHQFQQITAGLVRAGKLRQEGDVFYLPNAADYARAA